MPSQLKPKKDVNELPMDEIVGIMQRQQDPKRFVVRECFKFWSYLSRKPGKTIQDLAARMHQNAATCNFSAIDDPQDEAMRTRFICSVGNEAVLKMLFKEDNDKLTFTRAVELACETEDAVQFARDHLWIKEQSLNPVHAVRKKLNELATPHNSEQKPAYNASGTCMRCGNANHKANDCRYKQSTCNYCHKKGRLERVCLSKKRQRKAQQATATVNSIKSGDRGFSTQNVSKNASFQ